MKSQRASTITMSDIAYHAKVSEATVCRALNNSPLVSSETYRKIMAVAKALNYSVNKHASALRRMHSNQILLVNCTREGLAPADNFLYLSWLNHFLYKADYVPLLSQLDTNKHLTSLPGSLSAAGIIFIQQPHQQVDLSAFASFFHQNIPVIFLGDRAPELENHRRIHSIHSDDWAAAYYLTGKLIEQGCHKLLYLEDKNMASDIRYNGYKQCLKDHQLNHPTPIQLDTNSPISDHTINSIQNSDGIFLSSNRLCRFFERITLKPDAKSIRPKIVTIQDDSQNTVEEYIAVADHSVENMCKLAIQSLLKEPSHTETSTSLVTMTYSH